MFRWPTMLTVLSTGSAGAPRTGTLEVTPRGAALTLAALSHVGHTAHLALVDAYMKGQVRLTQSTGIGDDARIVVSALATPIVAAFELGMDRITLADLVMLPRARSNDDDGRPDTQHGPMRGPDSPRLILRAPRGWVWVRGAERFERAGCLGTPRPGGGSPWYDVITSLPSPPHPDAWSSGDLALAPIEIEVREATVAVPVSPPLACALDSLAHARFARAPGPARRAADAVLHLLTASQDPSMPVHRDEIVREREAAARVAIPARRVENPRGLADVVLAARQERTRVECTMSWRGCEIDAALVPEPDGYQALCLLPQGNADAATLFETMRDLAWETIPGLIGRPLAEYRTEPIALRLVGADDRSTTLEIGASIVIIRNDIVFAGWVGSDGRVMLRLFPPGGMPSR